jgi:sulfatase modifying factor 1
MKRTSINKGLGPIVLKSLFPLRVFTATLLISGCSSTQDTGHIKRGDAYFSAEPSGGAFTNSIGMKFVLIPDGTFTMGSPSNEPERERDEKLHRVTISEPFFMQTTEVTQGQWREVMGNNPSFFKACGDDCPVETVSWNDVRDFIRNLNQKEGTDKYRLPTEAEWEYACRAGTGTPFYFGNCLSTDQANYDGMFPIPGCPRGEFRRRTLPVGSFQPNAWGLYDMHGNVAEWCNDWSGGYPSGHITDPTGPSSGQYPVLRGGSWGYSAANTRSAYRYGYFPDGRGLSNGFRVARTF